MGQFLRNFEGSKLREFLIKEVVLSSFELTFQNLKAET